MLPLGRVHGLTHYKDQIYAKILIRVMRKTIDITKRYRNQDHESVEQCGFSTHTRTEGSNSLQIYVA